MLIGASSRPALAALAGGLALLLSAWPSPAALASDPTVVTISAASERALRTRVLAWWSARVTRDHQTMYALYEPAYRKKTPFAAFLQESAVRVRFDLASPEVVSIAPRSRAEVRVKVRLVADLGRFGGGHTVEPEETWVLRQSRWFKVYEPPALPFPASE